MRQRMNYELSTKGTTFERGSVEAEGDTVFEMTEDVIRKLSMCFAPELDFDFIDVSNEWTFSAEDDEGTVHEVRFAPEGIHADKYGIED